MGSLDKAPPCGHVICAAGVPDSMLDLVGRFRRGGSLLPFAGFPQDAPVGLDLNAIHYHELSRIGSSASTLDDFREALELRTSAAPF
jgi:threonine dehydrogenase-like Zn-dependent dehydrogenase